jgi:hypothetical protein
MRTIAAVTSLIAALLVCPQAAASLTWQWPVEGRVITPYRNAADPYAGGQHRGIDIAAPVGTPVVAATAGTVAFAGSVGSSGLTVAVRTDDGFDTSYLHLSAVRVRAGERVAAGAELGAVGITGRRSAAEPHLHFGVREAGSRFAYRDPLDFLPPPPAGPAPRGVPPPLSVPVAPRLEPVAGPLAEPAKPLSAALAPAAGPLALAPGPMAGLLGRPAGSALADPSRASIQTAGRSAVGGHGQAGRSPRAASQRPRAAQLAPGRRGLAAARRAVRPHAAHDPATDRHARPRAAPAPFAGPAAALDGSRASERVRAQRALARHRSAGRGGGIDVGWLAACVGLVAAAALLGRPRATAGSFRRSLALAPPIVRSPKTDRS